MKLKYIGIALVAVILSQLAGQSVVRDTQAQSLDSFTRTANHNYQATVGGEVVKIGSATNAFTPVIRFNKWNLESWLELNLVGGGSTTRFTQSSVSNGVVTAENNWFRLVYNTVGVKPPYNDIGGVDFSIALKQAPPINSITFTYNHQACDAFLQPPLTAQEIADGAVRPDYVVNSIAFYHDSKGGIVAAGQPYKTGKIGHLYRMRVTDNLGSQTWADWGFGGGQSQITLTIPAAWLAAAQYPVTISPVGDTFGYETSGGSAVTIENRIRAGRYQISADGTGTSISAFVTVTTASHNGKCHIYDDGTGSADMEVNLVTNGITGQVAMDVQDGSVEIAFNFVAGPSFTSGTYYRLSAAAAAASGDAQIRYDTTGGNYYYSTTTYDTWPDPNTFSTNTAYMSIYVTYTPSGGGWSTIAKVDAVAEASIAKIMGVAKAAIGKLNGITP